MKKLINLFKRQPPPPVVTPFLPDNTRVYCIGDIHGRLDLLRQLMTQIKDDARDFSGRIVMVYLGDFIDRGSSSKEVIDFILNDVQPQIEYVYLRGNHEQTLIDFLSDESIGRAWLLYGGQMALNSYGVAINKIPTRQQDFIEIQQQLIANLPPRHYQFYMQSRISYSLGAYFFVHAGVNPLYSLSEQNPDDMMRIREEFIGHKKPYEKIIVHGHTINEKPELLPHRIGIDTGAYATGVLTALVLENDQQRVLQTSYA